MDEAKELRALLNREFDGYYYRGWQELRDVGYELDGWHTVAVVPNGSGRWASFMQVITRSPAGNYYRWEYESGLTESQEDEYSDLDAPVRVFEDEKTIVVKVWKEAGK